jgi:metal-responsive CopG/Arc/MetJ family transcriptional regulator
MVREVHLKLSEELDDKLNELAGKLNKSKAELIREAILMYIGAGTVSDKTISNTSNYVAPAIYSGKCSKCGREIKQGELAGFIKIVYEDKSKKTFIYCMDCYQGLSDSTIVRLEIKRAKLERVVRALQRERDNLLRQLEDLESLADGVDKVHSVIINLDMYMERVFQGDNDTLKKLVAELRDLNDLLAEYVRLVRVKREYYLRIKQREE